MERTHGQGVPSFQGVGEPGPQLPQGAILNSVKLRGLPIQSLISKGWRTEGTCPMGHRDGHQS